LGVQRKVGRLTTLNGLREGQTATTVQADRGCGGRKKGTCVISAYDPHRERVSKPDRGGLVFGRGGAYKQSRLTVAKVLSWVGRRREERGISTGGSKTRGKRVVKSTTSEIRKKVLRDQQQWRDTFGACE